MMTSSEIRQSFLDFFKEQKHTVVPSASLMPQSPGLLFTNAGMNQFVPYFLGVWKAPYTPPRATDTQKCIRAGGKHNDLEDVGYDSYHHTFFEMLGNWSFGDYFKKEAIAWAWELIVERWHVPAERLYATVYCPDKAAGDPGEFDQDAYDAWASLFLSKGLDPKVHVVNGNVHDNFWMMGDTGPCGPCSELHVDLTPAGDTQGSLVNQSSDQCIEIWNLVFIQYNAETDGSFRNLPARHVDTGMGFERACAILQATKGFTDFSKKISNYSTDVFSPIFDKLQQLSGKTYQDIYPESTEADKSKLSLAMREAIAFRVIADHIRTLSFSIADGILPGNNGRNYVLRRILRRAVRYGRTLGFSGSKPFLTDLVDVLVENFGDIFPELKDRTQAIKDVLSREEAGFNETLDRGLELFEAEVKATQGQISGEFAFKLYDTYGFPIDLTTLLAAERGLSLDLNGFESLMEEQRQRARSARKSEVVRALDISTPVVTEFVGYDSIACEAEIKEVHESEGELYVITDKTPFYAEMGGQQGDEGVMMYQGLSIPVKGVQSLGNARAHIVKADSNLVLKPGDKVELKVDEDRRHAIEANHTATHLLHRALHVIVSSDASQQGSLVTPDRLRFDFNAGALTAQQIQDIEEMVNGWILDKSPVYSSEYNYADLKANKGVMQFFGDKYGDVVRVVQVGGAKGALDGFSMELCGGTHIDNLGHIGLFKIKSEGAIASGVRRIEATTGEGVKVWVKEHLKQLADEGLIYREKLIEANERLSDMGADVVSFPEIDDKYALKAIHATTIQDVNEGIKGFTAYINKIKNLAVEAEKSLKKAQSAAMASVADAYLTEALSAETTSLVASLKGTSDLVQELLNGLKKRQYSGAGFFAVDDGKVLQLAAFAGADAQAKGIQAGKLIQTLAPFAGGKGGGRPDQARGSAPKRELVEGLLTEARQVLA